jgi:hypothetical protein
VYSEVERIWKAAVVTQQVSLGDLRKPQKHHVGNKHQAIQNVHIMNISVADVTSYAISEYESCGVSSIPSVTVYLIS